MRVGRRSASHNRKQTFVAPEAKLQHTFSGPCTWKLFGLCNQLMTRGVGDEGMLSDQYITWLGSNWKYVKVNWVMIKFKWFGYQIAAVPTKVESGTPAASAIIEDTAPEFFWQTYAGQGSATGGDAMGSVESAKKSGVKSIRIKHGQEWSLKFRPYWKSDTSVWCSATEGAHTQTCYYNTWQKAKYMPLDDVGTGGTGLLRGASHYCGRYAVTGLQQGDEISVRSSVCFTVKGFKEPSAQTDDNNELDDTAGDKLTGQPPYEEEMVGDEVKEMVEDVVLGGAGVDN